MWTDDPVADFNRRDNEEIAWLKRRPKCCNCNQHIQDDTFYEIDGNFYCAECLKNDFRRWTENYINR
jgi:late competence protein required for DNA uptake (superfamily II DNA/RNA helicase)